MDIELYSAILGHQTIQFVIGLVFILIIISIFRSASQPRKSYQYRKLLTDLYVAGKIRKFAETDDISFKDEEANFNRWLKKQRLKEISLDGSVEEELQEKIAKAGIEETKTKK